MRYSFLSLTVFALLAVPVEAQATDEDQASAAAQADVSLSAEGALLSPPAADNAGATDQNPIIAPTAFDTGKLLVGLRLSTNRSNLDLGEAKGRWGGGVALALHYVPIPYFQFGLELGYLSAKFRNKTVTDSGSNVVDVLLNLYVDPEDLISKRGGRGNVSHDAIVLPLIAKGRYPVAVGKPGIFIAPFLSLGGQLQFNTSSRYDVQNDDKFDYSDGLNAVDFKLLVGLGLDFSLGQYGQIGLEGRYLLGVTEQPGQHVQLNSRPNEQTESLFPLDFTVPTNQWSLLQLSLSYRYALDR